MAIGIIGALEAIEGNARPDDNSVVPPIDRLASLPQALIMQMAQKGQISKTMVPAVLAKKAENAQAAAQIKAVAQQMAQQQQMGGPPPSTVIEKVIAQNAAQETAPPMNRSNVGVASAPMRPDMYRRGMAGGGIVAFGNGGLLEEYSKLPKFDFDTMETPRIESAGDVVEKLRKRYLAGDVRRAPDGKPVTFGEFMRMREQDMIREAKTLPADPNVGFMDDAINPVGRGEDNNPLANARLLGASAEVKAEPIYDEKTGKVIYPEGYTDIKEGEPSERAAVRDYLAEGKRQDFLPEEGEKPTAEQESRAAEYFAEQRAAREIPKSGPTDEDLLGRPEGEVEGLGDVVADMADKTQAIMDIIGLQKPKDFKPDDFSVENTRSLFTDAGVNLDLLSDQARKLGDERLKLKEDKKEALAFFGLEAGLNILAGKDPNALVNIGAGAGKAIAPLRKELTRLKDQHNSLRKEENQLARMQSQQDMGIAKFSQERLNDARKSYDANLRNYNTTRAQIANRVLTDNSALQRVKISAGATIKSSQLRADASAATALGTKRRSDTMNTIKALESLKNTREYRDIERKIRKAKTGEDRNAARKELIDLENKRLEQLGLPPLQDPITSDRYEGYKVTEIKN